MPIDNAPIIENMMGESKELCEHKDNSKINQE